MKNKMFYLIIVSIILTGCGSYVEEEPVSDGIVSSEAVSLSKAESFLIKDTNDVKNEEEVLAYINDGKEVIKESMLEDYELSLKIASNVNEVKNRYEAIQEEKEAKRIKEQEEKEALEQKIKEKKAKEAAKVEADKKQIPRTTPRSQLPDVLMKHVGDIVYSREYSQYWGWVFQGEDVIYLNPDKGQYHSYTLHHEAAHLFDFHGSNTYGYGRFSGTDEWLSIWNEEWVGTYFYGASDPVEAFAETVAWVYTGSLLEGVNFGGMNLSYDHNLYNIKPKSVEFVNNVLKKY